MKRLIFGTFLILTSLSCQKDSVIVFDSEYEINLEYYDDIHLIDAIEKEKSLIVLGHVRQGDALIIYEVNSEGEYTIANVLDRQRGENAVRIKAWKNGYLLLSRCRKFTDNICIDAFDQDHNLLWSKEVNKNEDYYPTGLTVLENGQFTVVGYKVTQQQIRQPFAFFYSSNGQIIREKHFKNKGTFGFTDIQTRSTGEHIVYGYIENSFSKKNDLCLIKLAQNGDSLHTRVYSTAAIEYSSFSHLGDNDDIYLAAHSWDPGNQPQMLIMKVSLKYFFEDWTKYIGGLYSQEGGVDVTVLSNGNILFLGIASSTSQVQDNILLVETDKNGNLVSRYSYGDEGKYHPAKVLQVKGTTYLIGSYTPRIPGPIQGYIKKIRNH